MDPTQVNLPDLPHVAHGTPIPPRPNNLRKWVRTWLLEHTVRRIPKSRDVLDLCCGYGFYFSINPNARGIDGDPASVAHLKAKGLDVQLCNVLEGIPFPDSEFRYVIAHDVLEHFLYPDLEKIFLEVHRVLKPGGFFIAIQPNRKGFDFGLTTNAGHQLFVTAEHVSKLAGDRFWLRRQYAEPLPRLVGEFFVHNKEVFWLEKK